MTLTAAPALATPPQVPQEEQATEITVTTARFSGVLDSAGKGEAGSYAFVYSASATECEGISQQESAGVSTGESQYVEVNVTDLLPATTYTFCLVARNAALEESAGVPVTFTTGSTMPPIVGKEAATSIGTSTATVSAAIDPGGLPTEYHVEYLTEAQYAAHGWTEALRQPVGDADLPAGSDALPVSEQLGDLQPGTTYRFRFSASNQRGASEGLEGIFATFSEGTTVSSLPDKRVYEVVSGTDNPGDVNVPGSARQDYPAADATTEYPYRAAAGGDAIAYVGAPGYTGGQGIQDSDFGNEFMATRDPTQGWQATDITPAVSDPGEENSLSAYEFFSEDLSFAALTTERSRTFGAAASPPGPPECAGIYSRDSGGYHALFSKEPAPFSCGRIKEFGQVDEQNLMFSGASADGSQMLFQTPAALVAEASPISEEPLREGNNLYDSVGGTPVLVNVLPGQSPPPADYGGPPHNGGWGLPGDLSDVFSEDGTKVFWTDLLDQRIYMRENPDQPASPLVEGRCTVPADACTVPVSTGAAQYWGATPDGHYVFYTEGERLWRFDSLSESREALVSTGVNGEEANVLGVIGVGGEGSYVYFIAEAQLSRAADEHGEAPTRRVCESAEGEQEGHLSPGKGCNLYVLHVGEQPVYIGALGIQDNQINAYDAKTAGDWQPDIGQRTAEVTPDGSHLVFESSQQMTGYDSSALASEQGGIEAFVYAAQDGGPGRLVCATCDPTGAPPVTGLAGGGGGPHLVTSAHPTYMPRWLSNDGNRLFFDSTQPLAPQDVNGIQDVYEWEREGDGSCQTQASPQPDGGCVFLLSGGESSDDSDFIDADATGENVFFVHRGRVGQAGPADEKAEVLDARVDGGFPEVALACTGTGCQGVPPALPIFATPATVTFEGAPNPALVVAPKTKPVKAKTAAQIRAEHLAQALNTCRKRPSKQKRKSCAARARSRYGARHVTARTKVSRSGHAKPKSRGARAGR